jgi:hypothetical protein
MPANQVFIATKTPLANTGPQIKTAIIFSNSVLIMKIKTPICSMVLTYYGACAVSGWDWVGSTQRVVGPTQKNRAVGAVGPASYKIWVIEAGTERPSGLVRLTHLAYLDSIAAAPRALIEYR